MTRPPKQEQEPASPEVSEVAPGVLRMQIPINFTGLGHVNAYALLDDRGAAIVDVGLPGKETWAAIQARLGAAGLTLRDVHTVLITHSHPDHFGSAGRLAHEAGAEVVTHQRFHTWLERLPHDRSSHAAHGQGTEADNLHASVEDRASIEDRGDRTGEAEDRAAAEEERDRAAPEDDDTGYFALMRARRTPWGGTPFPQSARQRLTRSLARHNLVPSQRPPVPTKRVEDGDRLVLAGREWRAIHTPGHTGDHLCLYDPTEELLVSGDHVLPTITPHVGGLSPLEDPLGSFLASLAKLLTIGPVRETLPAHGHPFLSLEARIREIVDHHDERLASLREIGSSGEQASVVEISQQLFRKPLWGMMAESETYAHLEFLRLRGDAERARLSDGQLAYRIVGGSSSAREAAFGVRAEGETS